ncbi:MAG TPA: phosphoserine phosphatase SerB, partial [Rhizomicrobium sp.]
MPEPFSFVLNVISPEAGALAGPLRALAAEHGAAAGEISCLAPERAFDIPFLDHCSEVLAAGRALTRNMAADINVIPAANRCKKLLIADMESTIIDCEVLDELADMAGLKGKVAPLTEAAMRGEIAFEPALRQRASFLAGLPVSWLERVYRDRVHLNPGARELVATMRAHGARTMLISSGFRYFTRRVARDCGFDSEQANELLHAGGMFTGKVAEPILGRDAKLRALRDAVAEMHIQLSDTLAVGDGANDLAIIEAAGLGVGYHPKPALAEAADANIVHSDLTGLLY